MASRSAGRGAPGPDPFDVLVVGSGASGGWVAKRLTEAGIEVALLEAGRARTAGDDREHAPAFALQYRDQAPEVIRRTRPVQKDCYACMEWNYDWFANDLEEPYSTEAGKPFSWQGRLRLVGGRTNVWGRHSYRLSDLDFKAASRDGYGEDWPLSYSDLSPYYDLVEEYVGISGQAEGKAELPDGRFQPPMGMHCAEARLRQRVKQKLGYTVTMGRVANLTRPLPGRAACHYCGPCERGCATRSYFNSAFTTVADALATGQRLPADPRHRQPLRDGRLRLHVQRVPEPDPHHHGPGRALHRLPPRGDAARRSLTDRTRISLPPPPAPLGGYGRGGSS